MVWNLSSEAIRGLRIFQRFSPPEGAVDAYRMLWVKMRMDRGDEVFILRMRVMNTSKVSRITVIVFELIMV